MSASPTRPTSTEPDAPPAHPVEWHIAVPMTDRAFTDALIAGLATVVHTDRGPFLDSELVTVLAHTAWAAWQAAHTQLPGCPSFGQCRVWRDERRTP